MSRRRTPHGARPHPRAGYRAPAPSCPNVAQQSPKRGSRVVEKLGPRPNFVSDLTGIFNSGPTCPLWPTRGNFNLHWSILANFCPMLANVGQYSTEFGQYFGGLLRPVWANIGQHCISSGQEWTQLG